MSSSLVPAAPRPKRPRGVYLISAPRGMVRLQAVDSQGNEFMHITVAESAFSDAMATRMRALLDEHDPVRRFLLIRPD